MTPKSSLNFPAKSWTWHVCPYLRRTFRMVRAAICTILVSRRKRYYSIPILMTLSSVGCCSAPFSAERQASKFAWPKSENIGAPRRRHRVGENEATRRRKLSWPGIPPNMPEPLQYIICCFPAFNASRQSSASLLPWLRRKRRPGAVSPQRIALE